MRRKSWIAAVVMATLSLVMLTSGAVLSAEPVWDAKYWDNTTLSGNPVVQRGDGELNFDWGGGTPDPLLPKDSFSARWERKINVSAGTYRFTATMDDGMRVWVDGVLIIDSWWNSQVHSMSADRYLSSGDHQMKVEYYETGGDAVAKLKRDFLSGSPTSIQYWRGEYYNNNSLNGSPVLVRDDPEINFDWGTGSPQSAVPADNFSVRWTRQLALNNGRYIFVATADDGVRLWVNNSLIIDQWHNAAATPYSVEVNVPGGSIPVKLEFYEQNGAAIAKLGWSQIGGTNITQWRGEYYSNKFLVGSPVLVRDDAQINFNWGLGSPASGIGADDFGVRWTRNLDLAAGRYRFTASSDDGVRLWVNNSLIIDQWTDRAIQAFSAEINLPGGAVPVKLEYYDNLQLAEVHLNWTTVSGTSPPSSGQYTATVTANRLNVRQGPGTNYTIITTIDRNTAVTLVSRNSAATWVKVILPGGTAGWVSGTYLSNELKPFTFLPVEGGTTAPPTTPPPSGMTATVTNAGALNVRRGPGVSYGAITYILRFQEVTLVGYRNENATWVKIRLASGTEGWVNAYYLRTTYPLSSLAVGGW